jgi:prophage regulatory protein
MEVQMDHDTDALIDSRVTRQISGISKSERWRLIKKGRFPAPIRLGPRCTRFSLREVSDWVERRKAERGAKSA